MIRKASVMGQFYPAELSHVKEIISKWRRSGLVKGCRLAIVPHAGYIFSGECAWQALTMMDWEILDRVLIIGPSHHVGFDGVSVISADEYETVEAMHPMDKSFADELLEKLPLLSLESAHNEHSTEVQVPMIHQLAPKMPVVECVYGSNAEQSLIELIEAVYDTSTGIIISSDLSHYHSELDAHALDRFICRAVEELDAAQLSNGEACGMAGIESLITVCKNREDPLHIVDYCTSADSQYGENTQVVGYLSAVNGLLI